jgi:hypothetical protein
MLFLNLRFILQSVCMNVCSVKKDTKRSSNTLSIGIFFYGTDVIRNFYERQNQWLTIESGIKSRAGYNGACI